MNVTPKFYLMNAPQGPEITPVFPSTVAPHDQGLGRAPNANGELNSYRYATHVETNSMEKLSLGEEVLALLRAGSRPLFMSKSLLDKYASPRNSPQTTVRDESPQSVEEEGLENSAANKLN